MAIFDGQSFMGIPWSVEQVGGQIPLPTRESFVNTRHIPWSDKTVIELGGLGPRMLRCKAWVDQANLEAFQLCIQQTGTLVYRGNTHASSTLLRIDSRSMLIGEEGTSFDVEFLVDA